MLVFLLEDLTGTVPHVDSPARQVLDVYVEVPCLVFEGSRLPRMVGVVPVALVVQHLVLVVPLHYAQLNLRRKVEGLLLRPLGFCWEGPSHPMMGATSGASDGAGDAGASATATSLLLDSGACRLHFKDFCGTLVFLRPFPFGGML